MSSHEIRTSLDEQFENVKYFFAHVCLYAWNVSSGICCFWQLNQPNSTRQNKVPAPACLSVCLIFLLEQVS